MRTKALAGSPSSHQSRHHPLGVAQNTNTYYMTHSRICQMRFRTPKPDVWLYVGLLQIDGGGTEIIGADCETTPASQPQSTAIHLHRHPVTRSRCGHAAPSTAGPKGCMADPALVSLGHSSHKTRTNTLTSGQDRLALPGCPPVPRTALAIQKGISSSGVSSGTSNGGSSRSARVPRNCTVRAVSFSEAAGWPSRFR